MPWKDPNKRREYMRAWIRNRRAADPVFKAKGNLECRAWRKAYPEKQRQADLNSHAKKPWVSLISAAAHRARKKGVPHTLTEAWGAANYTGFCALTGLQFVLATRTGNRRGPIAYSPSIDRIVPSLGYTPDNCRFVLHCINSGKMDLTDAEFRKIMQALLIHTKEPTE
jgi:hypothetical protein